MARVEPAVVVGQQGTTSFSNPDLSRAIALLPVTGRIIEHSAVIMYYRWTVLVLEEFRPSDETIVISPFVCFL